MSDGILDLAGVGIGPFNLSVAALLDGQPGVSARFFDAKPRFAWHPGMMLPDAALQTSWMKDLVTPVQPTSPHGFLAYLVHHRRFYQFVTAGMPSVSRREFSDYLGWVAGRLDGLRFGARIDAVRFDGRQFELEHAGGRVRSRNLLLGAGHRPYRPAWLSGLPNAATLHAADFMSRPRSFAGQHVAVVGGGQSGAEIVLHLLRLAPHGVGRVSWISRRPNFQALDEVAFANEYFMPAYVQRFHALPEERRAGLVGAQKLASDGASPETLQAIYQRIYHLTHLDRCPGAARLLPHREVRDAVATAGGITLAMQNGFDGGLETLAVDRVIAATGYTPSLPDCLTPLSDRLALDAQGRLQVDPAFRVAWDGPPGAAIFAQNAGRHSHGIAEPQLSLMAWRSATIINALLGRLVFDLDDTAMIDWGGAVLPCGERESLSAAE